MSRPARLADDVVQQWTSAHRHWHSEDSHLVREVRTTDYPSAARIVQAQVALAERLDHHPDLTLGYRQLRVEVWTHDRAGVTQLDLDYAEGFDAIIADEFAAFVL